MNVSNAPISFPGLFGDWQFTVPSKALDIGNGVYWYGIIIAAGMLLGLYFCMKQAPKYGLSEDNIIDTVLWVVPFSIIGARIYYVLFYLDLFRGSDGSINWSSTYRIWDGGLAIYGAVIGGLLGMFIYSRVRKIRFLKLADCIAPGLVLAQAIGRWGNFFNQEAFGLPISNGELMWFPFAVYIEGYHTFNGQPCSNPYHMATFFYESVWCLIVFIILWSCRKKFRHDGDAILSYAALYGLERMFVERLRGDSLYIIKPGGAIAAGVRVSEMLSFILVVAIAAFFLIRHFKEKKLGRLIWPAPEAEAEEAAAPDEADSAGESEKEEAAGEKPEPEETDQGDSTEDGQ